MPKIDDEHYPSAIAIIPHFMQMRIIKYKTLAFAPVQNLPGHLHPAAIGNLDAEVTAKSHIRWASVRGNVRSRRKNGKVDET